MFILQCEWSKHQAFKSTLFGSLLRETVHYQSCSRAILSSSGASAKETDRCLYLCHEHASVRDFSFTDPVRTFTSTRPEICSVHSRLKSLGGFEMNVRSTFSTAYVQFAESSDLSKHKVKGRVVFYLFVTFDLVTWPVGASKGWREWKLVGGMGAHGFQQKYTPLDWARPLREHGDVFPVLY